ncbi:hypothetical protein D3C76_1105560 [compost metagenome]
MAITVLISPGPRMATMATASSSEGSASMMSIRRMITGPRRFGEKPASRPRTMPGISDITTEDRPISSDRRAPCISRESRSRPSSSVPRRNRAWPPSSHTGGVSRKSRNCSLGSNGATQGANSAQKTIRHMNSRPPTAPLLCAKCCQNSFSGEG